MSRLKALAVNLSLSAASLLAFILALEFAVFPLNLVHFPHRLQWRANDPLLVFSQSTRRHRVPRDYIAIVGDSHASGIISDDSGLAKWSSRGRAADAFLFEKLGRDVLAVGQPGAGSLGGLVGTPIGTWEFFHRTWLYKLPPPSDILVFFYEGNDLNDNIRELGLRYDGKYDAARWRDPDYFQGFIKDVPLKEHQFHERAQDFRWRDNLLFLRLCRAYWRKTVENYRAKRSAPTPAPRDRSAPKAPAAKEPPPTNNRVRLSGREVGIPDALQGPALELSAPELARAVWVFEQSLRFLAGFFPQARVFVVYVPSPLSCYELASRKVVVEQYHGRGGLYESRLVAARSDEIARLVSAASARAHCPFIDARPLMRAAARRQLIHGPRDWFHPNSAGYALLGQAVAVRLAR